MGTTGYLRFPTIYRDQLVFTAEDDLWSVSVDGGHAERLTAGVASATNAHFSPDGQQIAFTSSGEGPDEVYVMPSKGGPSRRLTYHAGHSEVVGWQPGGARILYASSAGLPSPRWRMLSGISPQGGEPVRLPYGIANAIAFGHGGAVVLGREICLSLPAGSVIVVGLLVICGSMYREQASSSGFLISTAISRPLAGWESVSFSFLITRA